MHVVIAPDSFKGSLTAAEAAAAMAAGARAAVPGVQVTSRPMADGGEGTLVALAAAWGAPPRALRTVDALGRPTTARWTVSPDGRTGVVELAEAAGLPGVGDVPRQPLAAHTRGVGELAAAVLDAGVEEVLVCLGGSASTDGGAGLLVGLGARLLDADGTPVAPGGGALGGVARIDLDGLHPRARAVRWRVAVDVSNPLVGPDGAAAVFGPQKGADDEQVALLDTALGRWADVLARITGTAVRDLPGGGAAGGTAAALAAVLGARLEPGADLVAAAVGLADAVADADLVLTGEGSFDSQSLRGKVPAGVARVARAAPGRPPVVVLAGRCAVPVDEMRAAGITAAFSIAPGPATVDDLVGAAAEHLARTSAQVVALTTRRTV